MRLRMLPGLILLWIGVSAIVSAQAAMPVLVITPAQGGCTVATDRYRATLDAQGNLKSVQAGGTEFIAQTGGTGPAAGFFRAGGLIPLQSLEQTAPDTIVAHGAPKDLAKSIANSPCPFEARITYHFLPDHIELSLEQSLDLYGGYAFFPSASIVSSRDALTDCGTPPAGPFLYGQTDPRWTTKEGPVLRFDFGVWQKGFANASWGRMTVDGKPLPFLQATVPGTVAMKISVWPLPKPAPKDALTFDISAADPDFLLPGGEPAHFDIKVTNAGPEPTRATVLFEVCDYLTRRPVATLATDVSLASKGEMALPTDLPLTRPGPYRGTIVIEEDGKPARTFGWVFTYDFQHYNPPTTRQPDFVQFWQEALAESAALPLDLKMTPVPEKSTATNDAFKISFATLGGRRIYGWYARPKAPGKYPAHIRFPSSGIYPLANPEIALNRCTLWIQIHGFDVDLSNMPTGDDPGKGYWTAGITSPRTSMWRTIYVSLVRAVDVMLAQPEVDPQRVAALGGSQGGGLSMVAAGLDHRIGFCAPYHSGLPRLDWTVTHEPGYWPFGMSAKPAGQTRREFLKTLSYFDAANFTQDIRCPVAAEMGMMDTVTASGNQICALAHVPPGLLYLVCSPWAMHGAGSRDSSLVQQCLNRFLAGEKPIEKPTRP